jgi:hypothetical protein
MSQIRTDHKLEKIYHTALFLEENNWVPYILPKDWILDDLKCYWPPRKLDSHRAMKYNLPPSDDWYLFNYRLLARGQLCKYT